MENFHDFRKILFSIKTDSDKNGFDSICFKEKLNLKAFVKVQQKIKDVYSNVNCINEKQTRI